MQSWKNVVESINNPVLVRGGPSSSDTLNRINSNIQTDILELSNKIDDLDRKQRLTSVYLSQQAIGIQALSSYLQTILPSVPSNRGVADFYSTEYIDATNTAEVDTNFGQVTLPVLSTQEKMFTVDLNGETWIPDESRIKFYVNNTYTPGTIPTDDNFLYSTEDHLGIGSQADTFFLGGQTASQTYVYLKGTIPQTLNVHKLANRLTFYPVPAFVHNLVGAYYKKTDGTWNSIDISYIIGYSTDKVTFLGPTRVHFTPSEIDEVCIVLQVNGWWGLQQFGVQLVEYDTSANLVVDMSDFNLGTINTVTLGGKDPSILSRYNPTVSSSIITVGINQTQSYSSPILTYVDVRA